MVKKFIAILVLGLLWCNVSVAEKIKLKCQGILEQVFKNVVYVTFDEKKIEIFQGSGGNKLEFEVKSIDEHFVDSWDRLLEKGAKKTLLSGKIETYDTYVSDWNEWYSSEFKKHLWWVKINRMEGFVGVAVSKKPYKKGKKDYKVEWAHEWECKKAGLSKF